MSTPVGYSILAKMVYSDCMVSICGRKTLVYLTELDMLDFDVILGIVWLYSFYASHDCRTQRVSFQFLNKSMIK